MIKALDLLLPVFVSIQLPLGLEAEDLGKMRLPLDRRDPAGGGAKQIIVLLSVETKPNQDD